MMARRAAPLLISLLLTLPPLLITASPAFAHCPGQSAVPHRFSGASYHSIVRSIGVQSQIQYTNPTICGGGTDPFSL